MSLAFVVDMNLSMEWLDPLRAEGWVADHWSHIGDPRSADADIMAWAAANGRIVLTHDLDFGTLLALSHATAPSVVLIRNQDVLPAVIGHAVLPAIRSHAADLAAGALLVVDLRRSRIRILPIG